MTSHSLALVPRSGLSRWRIVVTALAFVLAAVGQAGGGDWPAYDRDALRSAYTPEKLAFPLGKLWVHRAAQRPRPAWTEPGRTANMFGFDSAFQPVAAEGLVYFGSSADDTVYALRASDGAVQWTFTTGAPVRFAPHLAEGRCIFASDDGVIYSLDARSGKVQWQFNAARRERMIAGNGRMISRWPCRSGVVVHEGTVYATAGMFPSEGVYYYALDAATGQQRWCNDTLNAMYLSYPHDGVSFGGPTPQGYLLTDGARLVVPTGQSAPAVLDARSGKLLHWQQQKPGSTWARWGDGFVMAAGRGWQPDQDIRLGEAPLFRGDGVAFYDLATGEVTSQKKWLGYDALPGSVRQGHERWRGQVVPLGGRDRSILAQGKLYASGMGSLEAVDASGDTLRRLWKVDHPRIYSLILAGDMLVTGGDGSVSAIRAADGTLAWQGQVDGKVHGLAVADGVLYAATDTGTLYAFAAQRPNVPASRRLPADEPPRTGFALVVGSPGTAAAEQLAGATNLNVICLLADTASIPDARRQLLGRGYGQRLVVHPLPLSGRLPYANYFANQIVIDGNTAGIPPEELYRLVHPCTGEIRFLNMPDEEMARFAQQAGAAAGELNGGVLKRGPLEGAFDWNSPHEVDQRVKWPLELLWFGGPGRERTLARHRQGLPPPVAAFGRTIVAGDGYVTAVDAYNGFELWTRAAGNYQYLSADDRHVYVGLPSRVLQCDAQTGRLLKIFGAASPVLLSLADAKTFTAKPAGPYDGTIQVARTETALEVTLDTTTPTPDDKDCWTLWFDFRETRARLTPGGRGAFPLIVNTSHGTLRKFDGFVGAVAPDVRLSREGSKIRLAIPWEELEKLTGRKPADFELAAEITLHSDFQVRLRARPLTEGRDPWQNGTAIFASSAQSGLDPWKDVARAPLSELPAHAQGWGRAPLHVRHDGNVPRPPLAIQASPALRDRINPITGDSQDRRYLRGYGCSGTISSGTMDFFRSGTIGMYDLADDSGMRNFAGVRPGCRITIVPALGVLVSTEGVGDCFCPYNFSTTMALAPAHDRKQEDWAVFVDKTRVAPMQRLALNLGAPGDRRDESGQLWLGYPRQPMMLATGGSIGPSPHALGLPAELELLEGGESLRVNADRVAIEGARDPWVFASAISGVQKLSLGLLYRDPKSVCLAPPVKAPPKIDAVLDDEAWKGDAGLSLATDSKSLIKKGRVRARSDREHLYLGYEQLPIIDRKGVVAPWKDSYFDVLFKDALTSSYLHLTVNAEGTRTSRAINGVVAAPRLANVTVDGKPDDWRDQGVELPLDPGRGKLRVGWTDQGIVLLAQLAPQQAEKPGPGLRVQFGNRQDPAVVEALIDVRKKTVGMVTLAERKPVKGGAPAPDVVDEENPSKQELERVREVREIKPAMAAQQEAETLWVETLIPFEELKLKGAVGDVAELQVVVYDPEAADRNIAGGVGARRTLLGKGNMLSLVLAEKAEAGGAMPASALRREWFGYTVVFGARQRVVSTDAWKSASKTDDDSFRVEVSIPWRVLEAAGLSRERLLAQFHTTGGPISNLDVLGLKFAAGSFRMHASEQPLEPLGYLLRLHFAEIEAKKPGERIFDIKLQGRTVLEGFDIAREAGGVNRSLSKSFEIDPSQALTLECVPRMGLPLLNGLELIAREAK